MDPETIISRLSGRTPSILGSEQFLKYAVLLPLIQKEDGLHVLFEVRSLELRRQPGEVCFPGGKVDPNDQTEKEAAIRETMEELGIDKEQILKVFPLDYMVHSVNTMLFPFAGFIDDPLRIRPNLTEVAEIFTVPLSFFFHTKPEIYHVNLLPVPEENFPYELLVGGQDYKWQIRKMDEYFYRYENRVIWGLTAKILTHFIDLIR